MLRVALVLAAAAVALLLWLRLGAEEERRATRTTGAAGAAAAPREPPAPAPEEEKPALPPKRAAPAILRGTVYGPGGEPMRAELDVLWPKVYECAFSDKDGRYELEFERPGRYLVEASATIQTTPSRTHVVIEEEGDPAAVDFRLEPAGFVFGELLASGAPVAKANVDILWDGKWILDTTCENGFFTFTDEPPANVPLRLRVETLEGVLEREVEFVYPGKPLSLGQIQLTRHPAVRVRFRLPDGSLSQSVGAWDARRAVAGAEEVDRAPEQPHHIIAYTLDDVVFVREPGLARLVLEGFSEDTGSHYAVQDLFFAPGALEEVEVAIRPGPLTVVSRLVDEHGRGVRARFVHGESLAESRDDGSFAITLPCGGLFALRLAALHVESAGWVTLLPDEDAGFLLDADRPDTPCVLGLDRRILLVAGPGIAAYVGGGVHLTRVWGEETGAFGALSEPLAAGTYRLRRHRIHPKTHRLEILSPPEGEPFEVAERGLTIVDAR